MTHGHTYHVKYGLSELKMSARSAKADILLYGHTHDPYTEYDDGLYIMNPGAVLGYPSEYGVIDIQNGQILMNTAAY